MDSSTVLDGAGRWFLSSGIIEANGGVARYRRIDLGRNAPISHEITGYAVSALLYLARSTGREEYRDAALRSARYLVQEAWDEQAANFPFEPARPGRLYFFDCGIIIRGLLAAWRASREEAFLDRARRAGLALAFDFLGDDGFHPVVELPEKQPAGREARWSRMPGCYQLKSALAWAELARETGEARWREAFLAERGRALATQASFLPGDPDPEAVMDRLHAYCYFLEALLFEPDAAVLREGIARVARLLRQIRPVFERSDVNAQLLRVRLGADRLGLEPLDREAAEDEARAAAGYQAASGGFNFGRRRGELSGFENPVSTAFCAQALGWWAAESRLEELV